MKQPSEPTTPAQASPSQEQSLREKVLRALMTAPNNMQEKTINGKTITVFEVQNYNHLVDLIQESNRQARLDELEQYCDLLLGKQQEYLDTDWYDKSLSAEDVFRIKNDRIKALKDHQGGEI